VFFALPDVSCLDGVPDMHALCPRKMQTSINRGQLPDVNPARSQNNLLAEAYELPAAGQSDPIAAFWGGQFPGGGTAGTAPRNNGATSFIRGALACALVHKRIPCKCKQCILFLPSVSSVFHFFCVSICFLLFPEGLWCQSTFSISMSSPGLLPGSWRPRVAPVPNHAFGRIMACHRSSSRLREFGSD
jgi:hypothetical protein